VYCGLAAFPSGPGKPNFSKMYFLHENRGDLRKDHNPDYLRVKYSFLRRGYNTFPGGNVCGIHVLITGSPKRFDLISPLNNMTTRVAVEA
jgi:hypothetical protein